MPSDVSVGGVADGAHDVMVAKVRVLQPPSYLGGRDDSGQRPTNRPLDTFFARISIVESYTGVGVVGQTYDVRFAPRSDKRVFIYPYTPEQLSREYFVVIYVDPSDALRRLAAFPIGDSEYEQWKAETSAYTKFRGKPGDRQ